jgi:F-type H+/Na+-transporting ATPase subunit alpha
MRLVELLKQPQYSGMAVEDQVISIYAGTGGFLDDVDVTQVRRFESSLLAFIRDKYPEIPENIRQSKDFSDDTAETLKKAITAFKAQFKPDA